MVNVWVNDVVNERASCLMLSRLCLHVAVGEFFCVQVLFGVLVLMSE